MATSALIIGLLINQIRNEPLPLIYASKQARIDAAVRTVEVGTHSFPATGTTEPVPIGLDELKVLVESGNALILDARPEIFYRLGHIPGALSLPREAFKEEYATQRDVLEARRDRPVVVYCSNSACEDSQLVADSLVKLDFKKVLIYKGGWSEWTGNGLPEERK